MGGRAVTLVFLRHGEAVGNAEGRYLGHLDVPLTERGYRQAEEAGRALAAVPVAAVYASDLVRATETARRVVALRKDAPPLRVTAVLRELAFGAWEGKTYAEVAAHDPARLRRWYADPLTVAPPGGERLTDLLARLGLFLAYVWHRHAGQTVLVVTHGGCIRALRAFWGRTQPWASGTWEAFWSAGVAPGAWTVWSIGSWGGSEHAAGKDADGARDGVGRWEERTGDGLVPPVCP